MASVVYNIMLNKGDDFELQITVKDATGNAIDLTGYTYYGQIRSSFDAELPVATFVCTIANQNTDKGLVYIRLPHGQSSEIPVLGSKGNNRRPTTEYIYDIEETTQGGIISRIMEGTVTVSPNVTR